MAKRNPLRDLIRQFPRFEEMDGVLEGLEKENDRSVAIIGAALLEGMLERIITHRLSNKEPNLIGQLFNNRGPLSDFHSKILVASALGIIAPHMEREFGRIKTVRNVFAHASNAVSFGTKEIADEIQGAIMLKAMQRASLERGGPDMTLPARGAFILLIKIMMIAYDGWHQQVGGTPIAYFFSDCQPPSARSRSSDRSRSKSRKRKPPKEQSS